MSHLLNRAGQISKGEPKSTASGTNVNSGSSKLVNKRFGSLGQYGDGGLIVLNVVPVMGTAVGNQTDLSSAYNSSEEKVIKVKVIGMYDLDSRGRRGKEANLLSSI